MGSNHNPLSDPGRTLDTIESIPLPTIMVRHREGKTLVYNHTACLQETWGLTCCSSIQRISKETNICVIQKASPSPSKLGP